MNKRFNDIFEECLDRVLSRGESMEQCLRSYPEHAAELRPLIETALKAKSASLIEPTPEFRARARYQFQAALNQAAVKPQRSWLGWMPRWTPAVALVVTLLAAGSGTVAAASNSMPDSPLYNIKMVTEQFQMGLARSDEAKAEVTVSLANRRVEEIAYMAGKGDGQAIEAITARLDEKLGELAGLANQGNFSRSQDAAAGAQPPAPEPKPAFAPQSDTPAKSSSVANASAAPSVAAVSGPKAASLETETPELEKAPEETFRTATRDNSEKTKIRADIIKYALEHPALLQRVLEAAPENSRAALEHSIAVLIKRYGETLRALD